MGPTGKHLWQWQGKQKHLFKEEMCITPVDPFRALERNEDGKQYLGATCALDKFQVQNMIAVLGWQKEWTNKTFWTHGLTLGELRLVYLTLL